MIKRIRKVPIALVSLAVLAGLAAGCAKEKKPEEQVAIQDEDRQLYTCGMHPNVIQEEPGNCPICGMELVPVGQPVAALSGPSDQTGERKILYWRAPMDPTFISPRPGKSPMGMDLVPVYEGEEAFGSTVRINPTVEQNMGIRTATVQRRNLTQTIRAVGRIDYDESRVAHVHTKFSGWIEKAYVNTTGQRVRKGEVLLDIYSPQLVSAQDEFLDALKNLTTGGESAVPARKENLERMVFSARRRLEYFDISNQQIEQLSRTGIVNKTLAVQSPFSGIVVEKHALDGMEVSPGMRLYTIADLSEIWVYADIYEYEVPWVREGQTAVMTLSYDPGKAYRGEVQYVYPYLEEKTRTIRVRLSFSNPKLELKPGMYANVGIETSPLEDVVAVPMEAVLFSGERNLVFVSLGDGRYVPRDVVIGIESGGGYYEVKKGLAEGEVVVTSGQFLLDSESKLQESISRLLQARTGPSKSQPGEEEMEHEHDMEMP
ncbi:MAG: efflux RND transporter periplasmic adaptor subunit [Fidelibacterota bacterium]